MTSRHNSVDNSSSSNSGILEKLASIPLLCNVLETQMYNESYAQRSGNPQRYNSTENVSNTHSQQQQNYLNSINKSTYEMFHSSKDITRQKHERPYRRQSLPTPAYHSSSNGMPLQRFQAGHSVGPSKSYALSSERNFRRHSNSPIYPLNKLYDAHDLRNVADRKPNVISNLDLESTPEQLLNHHSTMTSSTHILAHESLSETRNAVEKAVSAEVIDLTEADLEPRSSVSSSSQTAAKSRNDSKSEDSDSVFDMDKGTEQTKAKLRVTGLKRPRYSELTGFNDNAHSFANKKMRRASGPDRFASHTSSSTYSRPRENSRSTSPYPTDLPFTLKTLTEEIKKESTECLQSSALLAKKQTLRSVLENIFRVQFPGCVLHLVGSSVNGLGNEQSDADFCLMLTQWREIDQRSEARGILLKLNRLLSSCSFVEGNQVIFATVPIIKFVDSVSRCECDININNHVGIRNTFLIKAYCKVDQRVGPLVMVVKTWAKKHGINDSKDGTLSSYALTLMVIHYLQCGCHPAVLPSLQKEFFSENGDINVLLKQDVEKIILDANVTKSPNHQTLGELLLGFFQYYADQFNWDKDIISVRLGRTYDKSLYGKARNKYIYIEEPFDYNNVAKTVYCEEKFNKIKMKISLAANKLKVSPSLKSIL
ncbi:poly(A) RNA polymerase GLD2-like isoform X2 [Actinia tenebrosa]|uniref:Poly(A) RNA polymerase GLD2-like isoform X2 n=1 Tax=Actinia tenebrosa TaxID=6105 RepID=A0A6P8H9P0_ACTTE|nr:poly(A) RNA polymerase GLD2-like isoform X2 [Actinia tenebrosa]